jgi:hypothetical protein
MAFRAIVRGGRIVLDEATLLPNGTVLNLVADDEGDDLDARERAGLEAMISTAVDEALAGRGRSAPEVMAELRPRRRSP